MHAIRSGFGAANPVLSQAKIPSPKTLMRMLVRFRIGPMCMLMFLALLVGMFRRNPALAMRFVVRVFMGVLMRMTMGMLMTVD